MNRHKPNRAERKEFEDVEVYEEFDDDQEADQLDGGNGFQYPNHWAVPNEGKPKIVTFEDGDYIEQHVKTDTEEYFEYVRCEPITDMSEVKPQTMDRNGYQTLYVPKSNGVKYEEYEYHEYPEHYFKPELHHRVIKEEVLAEEDDLEDPDYDQHEQDFVKDDEEYFDELEYMEPYQDPSAPSTSASASNRRSSSNYSGRRYSQEPKRRAPPPPPPPPVRPKVEADTLLVEYQWNPRFNVREAAAAMANRKRKHTPTVYHQYAPPPPPPPPPKPKPKPLLPVASIGREVKKALRELDREFSVNVRKSRHDWLSGPSGVRREIIAKFPENMHPTPKELLHFAEVMGVTYRMVFLNYERLRLNHKVNCPEDDNCCRIKDYFDGSSTHTGPVELAPPVRKNLDAEINKLLEKHVRMTTGHIHVLCDITGLQPSIVRARTIEIRRTQINTHANIPEKIKKEMGLKELFDENPFPNPNRYYEFAARFKLAYPEVLAYFNLERRRHIMKNGWYDGVQQKLMKKTSDALWRVAKEGKHVTHEQRCKMAKQLSLNYITVYFWLDNYMAQLSCKTDAEAKEAGIESKTEL